jgi:hypothetical protein
MSEMRGIADIGLPPIIFHYRNQKRALAAFAFDVRFTPESGHSPTRSGCLLWADTVAKRFLTLERRILFPHFRGIRNIDSRRRSFGFYYCPFLLVGRGSGDFCNSIPPKADIRHRSDLMSFKANVAKLPELVRPLN